MQSDLASGAPSWPQVGPKLALSWPKLAAFEVPEAQVHVHWTKLRYIGRFWTPCRGTQELRDPAELAGPKSGQAKIPSNCSYMY